MELYLKMSSHRKSYMLYRTVPFLVTLNDPKVSFQGYAII